MYIDLYEIYSYWLEFFMCVSEAVHWQMQIKTEGMQSEQIKDTGQTRQKSHLHSAVLAEHTIDFREINSFLHHKQMNFSCLNLCCWKIQHFYWKKNGLLNL